MLTGSQKSSKWLGWKVISLLSKYRLRLTGLALLILIATGLDLTVPFLTRGLIDRIVHTLQDHGQGSIQILVFAGASIFAATAATRLLRSVYNYQLLKAASKSEDDVKCAAFLNLLKQDTAYHNSINTGEVVGALDRGGTAIYVVLYEILGQNLLPPLLIVVGVLTALVLKNPWMALLVSLPLPAYVLAISRMGKRLENHESEVSTAFEAVTKESYDIASNVRVVKKFAQEMRESQSQRSLLRKARGKHHDGELLWAFVENTQTFIATAGRVGVIAFGGYLVLSHQCSVGDYVLFISMQDMVYGPISQLSIIVPKLRRNLSRTEKLFEILESESNIADPADGRKLQPVNRGVEFKNLSFSYAGTDRRTLDDVNVSVPAGATVALIGASGSGKSTLMNLLQRLYDPQEGSIEIGGVDIRDVTQQSLREQIAIVPQEVELFSRSILENIRYGLNGVTREDVEHAARMAQAHEFIMRCDQGYDSPVGERGAKLSGGERQRIGIARAILRNPRILILDEATSHLDNESERLIQLALENLTRERTCFVIAHRLSTVHGADLVVVFAEGGIEAVGTHEKLWDISPTYRKLHGQHGSDKRAKVIPIRAAEPEREDRSDWLAAVGE